MEGQTASFSLISAGLIVETGPGLEKSKIPGYSKTNEYLICRSANLISPSISGFFFALVWFYFQPGYGKHLRAKMHRASVLISNVLIPAKRAESSVEPVSHDASVNSPGRENPNVQGLEDEELVVLISRELTPELELSQQEEVGAVENPMAPPSLLAAAKRLTIPKDEGERRVGIEERRV